MTHGFPGSGKPWLVEDLGDFAHGRHKTMLAHPKADAAPTAGLYLRRQTCCQSAAALVNLKQQFEAVSESGIGRPSLRAAVSQHVLERQPPGYLRPHRLGDVSLGALTLYPDHVGFLAILVVTMMTGIWLVSGSLLS